MKYFQTWQDFMRAPENKALKESKGIHACKQKFIQEQNKMQWYDPVMLQEGNQDAGVVNNANAADGGSTNFLTGKTAEVSTFTWVTNISSSITGSGATNAGGATFGITCYTLKAGVDYSYGHTEARKKVLLAIVTGSNMADLGGLSSTGYDVVVTASYANAAVAASTGVTGSIGNVLANAVANQGATAVLGGFTNTVAPSDLLTVSTGSEGAQGNEWTITNVVKGDVLTATTDLASDSGSVAVTTRGAMQFLGDSDFGYILSSTTDPHKSSPFASDISQI